ncbi:HDOD domain-containing protein [Methylomonas sp. AM2-LC]|uniref:HDOD domain-containing protein n=1 Tax=Methylomonas sp. AM2-LC TaxID=3153301 RepID=UPI00326443E4
MSIKEHGNTQLKLERLVDLPSLPVLLLDALQQTANNQNLTQLAEKIGQDPPMVAHILRIINSPFYGMPREIASLREAIVLLGMNRVRDLLFSTCLMNSLPTQHKDFDYLFFWHHSLAVANCARLLATHIGIGEDIAFTAGLLHDIGKLVIVLMFPTEYALIAKEAKFISVVKERQLMGFDHVEIGSKVAQHWNLPWVIQEAIEQHETLPSTEIISLGLLVYVANFLINTVEQNKTLALLESEEGAKVLDRLSISIEELETCVNTSEQFASQILSAL